jgi:phosphoserine aminotransferase
MAIAASEVRLRSCLLPRPAADRSPLAGIRTSIYNAVTLDQVKTLVAFMRDFRDQNP